MRPTLIAAAVLAAALASAPRAGAETLTIESLRSQVEAQTGEIAQMLELLRSPEPGTAMAAMRAMMSSDDPEHRRLALAEGLYSPRPEMRRAAIQAWLDAGPSLGVSFDLSATEDKGAVAMHEVQGSTDGTGGGYSSFQAGPYNPDLDCWVRAWQPSGCLVRLSEAGLSVLLYQDWALGVVGEDGIVRGAVDMRAAPSTPFTFPIVW